MAARSACVALLVALALLANSPASAQLLPLLPALPRGCAAILASEDGDTCDSLS
jgi:hypothetical protein